ncbi:MAG: arginase family protein, partial [Bacteroidota bacterium]
AQLDLFDPIAQDAWEMGLFQVPSNEAWKLKNDRLRPLAQDHIDFLESGGTIEENQAKKDQLTTLNTACLDLKNWVKKECAERLDAGKIVGLVGGEHATPLGLLEALSERYESFGILQIDAHMDLRKAYEGFVYSHASIFYNAVKLPSVTKLVQLGIRDYCEAEWALAQASSGKVEVLTDHALRQAQFKGTPFAETLQPYLDALPELVYISFDIDGLDPSLCPNTGTPVPGGFSFAEAVFILESVFHSGRKIIGFDLCETGGNTEWDGNVGARMLYKLANVTGKSQGFI